MASSKNPHDAIPVPEEIINLAAEKSGIFCNLRPEQRPVAEGETEKEKRFREIEEDLHDKYFLYHLVGSFLRSVSPGERLVLVCQHSQGSIFTLVTDVDRIYWADGRYPRIDFNKEPQAVKEIFGQGNLWGGFILAVARVEKKVENQIKEGFGIFLEIAGGSGAIKA